jgi:myo-inositol 2-dehydrogenase/D-chiro-inositol 1-dehydrogenase
MKRIAILGSTGSIGTQTLEVVRENDDIEVLALAAGNNITLLEAQIREFRPKLAAVWTEEKVKELRERVKDLDVKIVSGMDGLIEVSVIEGAEILVTAILGMIGIRPTIEAIKAGKHVFCEKPISQDLAKIKEVMETLKGSNVKYQVGFNRRFDHNFEAVRAAVADGKIGDVHIVKITSRDPDAPPLEYVRVSGGMFLDMTIHDFDMVRYLSGADVEEIYANGTCLVNPAIANEGDIDTAIITMKLTNGALAVIDNSRKADYGYDQRAEVFGSKGQVAVTNDAGSTAVISTNAGVTGEKPLYFFLERYMASFSKEVSLFVQACINDTAVPVDINDGLQPVLIAKAAKKSLDEGRPVKLAEIAAEF